MKRGILGNILGGRRSGGRQIGPQMEGSYKSKADRGYMGRGWCLVWFFYLLKGGSSVELPNQKFLATIFLILH